ncbi:hypothetical protein GCM10009609_42470 [Pseudonocardia aurantiaca]
MIVETLGLIGIAAIGYYLVVGRPRARRARVHTGLAALAPIMTAATVGNGPLTSTPGTSKLHLRGGYQGFHIEAWSETTDPRPAGSDDPSSPVNQFVVRCVGLNGRQPWNCQRRRVSLNPFAKDQLVFTASLDSESFLAGRLGQFIGLPPPDPELEQRLSGAGLLAEIAGLGHGPHSWLPHVRFVPPIDFTRGSRPPNVSWLECRVEVEHGLVPTAERFQQLLDCVVRLVHINARENPGSG